MADMGTKPLARSFIERYKLMMGIAPRLAEHGDPEVASVASGGHNLKSAVAALVSALLLHPTVGSELVAVDNTEKFDLHFAAVLMMVILVITGAVAYVSSLCCRKEVEQSLAIPLVVKVEVAIATPMPSTVPHPVVHRKNTVTAKTSMAIMAACIDSEHETRVGHNQFSVSVSCKRCSHHATWLYRQSDVSFRRHSPTAELIGDLWDKGREAYLAQSRRSVAKVVTA